MGRRGSLRTLTGGGAVMVAQWADNFRVKDTNTVLPRIRTVPGILMLGERKILPAEEGSHCCPVGEVDMIPVVHCTLLIPFPSLGKGAHWDRSRI